MSYDTTGGSFLIQLIHAAAFTTQPQIDLGAGAPDDWPSYSASGDNVCAASCPFWVRWASSWTSCFRSPSTVGRSILISCTTGGKSSTSIVGFLKRIGLLPPTTTKSHGKAGGSVPARPLSSAQRAKEDSLMCDSGSGRSHERVSFRIRSDNVSHTVRKLAGATLSERRWGSRAETKLCSTKT